MQFMHKLTHLELQKSQKNQLRTSTSPKCERAAE